jgi:hypothetical protein
VTITREIIELIRALMTVSGNAYAVTRIGVTSVVTHIGRDCLTLKLDDGSEVEVRAILTKQAG